MVATVYCVKLAWYPNRESRATLYPVNVRPLEYGSEERDSTNVLKPPAPPPSTLLDITDELDPPPQSDERKSERKPGYGGIPNPTVFGNNARRTLLRAGGALDTVCDKPSDTLLMTGTLPADNDAAFMTMSCWSSYIVWRLKKWVAKHIPSKYDMYVWEFQKRGALHLHYAIHSPDESKRAILKAGFKRTWISILSYVSKVSGCNLFEGREGNDWRDNPHWIQADCVEIERSATAYLAKYLSKTENSKEMGSRANRFPPARWWGVSRPLKALLDSMTVVHEVTYPRYSDALKRMEEVHHLLTGVCDSAYNYRCKAGGGQVVVAYNALTDVRSITACMTDQNQQLTESPTSLSPSVWTTTVLTQIQRRYSITPAQLSRQLGAFSGHCLERLIAQQSLSIIESMEVTNAMSYSLFLRYRGRNDVPSSVVKDRALLDALWKRLHDIRLMRNLSPTLPLTAID